MSKERENKSSTFRKIRNIVIGILCVHVIFLSLFYFFQEHVLFQQQKLTADYTFQFDHPHQEVYIPMTDKVNIHGLKFSSTRSKGLVLFFHGNGGTVRQWGQHASYYLEADYDVLFVDYRGYGKSDGAIESEAQLIDDAQAVYSFCQEYYDENKIVIVGLSMGTGIATQLAAQNRPKQLILMAPFFGLQELIREKAFVVPKYAIRYKFQSHLYLPFIKCPVSIMHGKNDRLIPIEHAEKLSSIMPSANFIKIDDCGHMIGRCGQNFEIALQKILAE